MIKNNTFFYGHLLFWPFLNQPVASTIFITPASTDANWRMQGQGNLNNFSQGDYEWQKTNIFAVSGGVNDVNHSTRIESQKSKEFVTVVIVQVIWGIHAI